MTEASLPARPMSGWFSLSPAEDSKPIPCQIITIETSNPDAPIEELGIKPCSAESCSRPMVPPTTPENST